MLDVCELKTFVLVVIRGKRIPGAARLRRRYVGRYCERVLVLFLVLVLSLDQHLHQVLHHLWVCEQIPVGLFISGVLQLLEHCAVVRNVWVDE